MGRVIKANLSVKSITDAIEQIRKYQEELDSKEKEFTKRLAEEGVQIAKANVVDLDAVFTSELLGSISKIGRFKPCNICRNRDGYGWCIITVSREITCRVCARKKIYYA